MKLLLDTHAFLWFIGGDKRLSPSAQVFIEEVSNDAYLSAYPKNVTDASLCVGISGIGMPLVRFFG